MTAQPGYPPPYPQQAYPPAPQQYAPPAQPAYPQQPQFPGYPQAPAQQYAPPAPQQPAQPLAQGTLDDFFNQPSSGGGPSLKFEQVGTTYVGVVARPLGPGDVQQQTDTQGRPLFFKDGRPKYVMKVPLQVQQSAEHPDGQAQWYVKGGARDELTRAMAEAGAPAGAPEPGATIQVTFVSTRPSGAGMNPAKVFQVRYTRPGGAQQTQAPAPQAQPQQQAPAPQQAPQQPAQPQFQPQVQQGGPQPPSDLSPEQQALLAQMTGQGS
jgi:hypothetical protein